MKKILLISVIIFFCVGCSTVSFKQTKEKFNIKGKRIEVVETLYEHTGYRPQWSPGKDISFEYHNI